MPLFLGRHRDGRESEGRVRAAKCAARPETSTNDMPEIYKSCSRLFARRDVIVFTAPAGSRGATARRAESDAPARSPRRSRRAALTFSSLRPRLQHLPRGKECVLGRISLRHAQRRRQEQSRRAPVVRPPRTTPPVRCVPCGPTWRIIRATSATTAATATSGVSCPRTRPHRADRPSAGPAHLRVLEETTAS